MEGLPGRRYQLSMAHNPQEGEEVVGWREGQGAAALKLLPAFFLAPLPGEMG